MFLSGNEFEIFEHVEIKSFFWVTYCFNNVSAFKKDQQNLFQAANKMHNLRFGQERTIFLQQIQKKRWIIGSREVVFGFYNNAVCIWVSNVGLQLFNFTVLVCALLKPLSIFAPSLFVILFLRRQNQLVFKNFLFECTFENLMMTLNCYWNLIGLKYNSSWPKHWPLKKFNSVDLKMQRGEKL